MKRATLWMCVALLTFSIGVACVVLWFLDYSSAKPQDSAAPAAAPLIPKTEPLKLKFCQLVAAPGDYEGKVIRVRAIYFFGIHGATLSDRSCQSRETQIWVSLTPSMWEEMERAMEKVYEIKKVIGPLDVEVVGRFGRNHPSLESDTLADNAPYRFELMRIESAAQPR